MSADAGVRLCRSAGFDAADRTAIRALLDASFAGDFSDDDWAHALGGTHAIVAADGAIVAHASVVPRLLEVDGFRLRVGYVEAVAVHPARQGTGLGTAVMRALAKVIAQEYAIGALSSGEWHFYERLGWERWQGPTWVRHADGRRERTPDDDDGLMILRTPSARPLDLSASLTCDARQGDPW